MTRWYLFSLESLIQYDFKALHCAYAKSNCQFFKMTNMFLNIVKYISLSFICFTLSANAQENFNHAEINGEITCIFSNGIPEHEIGKFPNKANPNKFKTQTLTFCFPSVPKLAETVSWELMTVGVSTTGIPIRPYTADYFDKNTKQGFSKNPSSGWRKQAMHDPRSLGIDSHNGHVDKTGLYHYHGIKRNLDTNKENVLLGYAPDGFKIFYNKDVTSSWRLKSGIRPTPPGGIHDGRFEEDFEYLPKSGSLDECNGKEIDGVYTYFATNSYPFFPRCFKGKIHLKFMKRN